ncbi:MAG: N-acetylmuramoyl-L-alanine amidase [Bacteroidetes bacterium]|nr:N-acetylmuramoyl-L-alanine amidase [Bacteroidota bacterium]
MKSIKVLILIFLFTQINYSQRTNLSGLKFCIDPGHGGNNPANDRRIEPDPGIIFWESEGNFQKALSLKKILESWGATIFLTRYTNYYPDDNQEPSLSARYTVANSNNVNWFHSIHSNATGGTNTSTNYTLILVKENITTRQAEFPEAVTMSTKMYNHIRKRNRTSPYGVRTDYTFYGGTNGGFNLGVLKGLLMPGQLSEGSFHDFYPETRRLLNLHYCRMEAYGIADGFLEYYGVPFDTLSTIAGVLTSEETSKPQNSTLVELLPQNKKYLTDNFNNGYFLFDSLFHGNYKLVFDLGGGKKDTVSHDLAKSDLKFLDKILPSFTPPSITYSSPKNGDTSVSVTAVMGVIFSKEMDTTSVKNAFSISPNLAVTTQWTNGNKTFVFRANDKLPYSTNFIIKIDSSARSKIGIAIDGNGDGVAGDAFIIKFRTVSQPDFVKLDNSIPLKFVLNQNYPNPFNPTTVIRFGIPNESNVRITIFNSLGQQVDEVVNERLNASFYEVNWNALNKPTGLYFYKIEAVDVTNPNNIFTQTKKMMLVK